jgi:hypothetical protein
MGWNAARYRQPGPRQLIIDTVSKTGNAVVELPATETVGDESGLRQAIAAVWQATRTKRHKQSGSNVFKDVILVGMVHNLTQEHFSKLVICPSILFGRAYCFYAFDDITIVNVLIARNL